MITDDEIWKDIVTIPYHQAEWSFHQVSNKGRVLRGGSVRLRVVVDTEVRKITCNSNGYMTIRHGPMTYKVHIFVLNAFVGPCPPGQECRHLNGDKSDNRWPENLVWGTRPENYQDRVRHGTDNGGERHGGAKLIESKVLEIKDNLYDSNRELAKKYGVSHQSISSIRNGQAWRSILK